MKLYKILFFFGIVLILFSCKEGANMKTIDVQGHRGCRGLMPENTIPGFLKAIEIGVTTLEMDLVISADKQVVVSHEPYFSHEISTGPNGEEISKANEKDYNLYRMSFDSIATFDVGLKPHRRFPKQIKMAASKPLFQEVVLQAEHYALQNKTNKPYYNIEIKRIPIYDSIYHPSGEEFSELVVEAVQSSGVKERVVIQSFDPESLQLVRQIDPEIGLVLLVENSLSPKENIDNLGFTPTVYSPNFLLVNEELLGYCKEMNMQLIPWTVNEKEDMMNLIELGVDGIITDYPDILREVMRILDVSKK